MELSEKKSFPKQEKSKGIMSLSDSDRGLGAGAESFKHIISKSKKKIDEGWHTVTQRHQRDLLSDSKDIIISLRHASGFVA